MPPIPTYYNYPRTFQSMEVYEKRDGRWLRDDEESDVIVHDQANEWLRETRAQLTKAEASTETVKLDETRRMYLLTLTIMYIPAIEGVTDVLKRDSEPDAADDVVGPVDSTAGSQESSATEGAESADTAG